DELLVIAVAVGARRLDERQHLLDGVDHGQEAAGDLAAVLELLVAQEGQEVLAGVADGLELAEAEEAAGALDGVDGAEDRRQLAGRRGVGLELEQLALETLEVLVTLDEELGDDIVVSAHGTSTSQRCAPLCDPWSRTRCEVTPPQRSSQT